MQQQSHLSRLERTHQLRIMLIICHDNFKLSQEAPCNRSLLRRPRRDFAFSKNSRLQYRPFSRIPSSCQTPSTELQPCSNLATCYRPPPSLIQASLVAACILLTENAFYAQTRRSKSETVHRSKCLTPRWATARVTSYSSNSNTRKCSTA